MPESDLHTEIELAATLGDWESVTAHLYAAMGNPVGLPTPKMLVDGKKEVDQNDHIRRSNRIGSAVILAMTSLGHTSFSPVPLFTTNQGEKRLATYRYAYTVFHEASQR